MWNVSTTWGSKITNETRCTRDIKSRTAMAEAPFNKKTYFTSIPDLNFKEEISSATFGA
jgi:hypothetical protein